jgi:predicted permease
MVAGMSRLFEDVRRGLAALSRRPVYAALATFLIAIGTAAATTVFSVVDQTILRRPPFLHGDRLVDVMNVRRGGGGSPRHSAEKALRWRDEPQVFERLETYSSRWFDIASGPEPQRIRGVAVSRGLFDLLGVQPFVGRGFVAEDVVPGADPVVVVSRGLAVRAFGTPSAALGAQLRLSGEPHTIVGVLASTVMLFGGEQVWLPIDPRHYVGQSAVQDFLVLARLPSGLPLATAQARANAIADRLQAEAPLRNWFWDIRIDEKRVALTSAPTRSALLVLLAGVWCLVLLTCVSTCLLVLARMAERRVEIAVRSSLGAGRWRLVREVMLEVGVLASAGGAMGVLASQWMLQSVAARTMADLAFQRTTPLGLDARVMLAALATIALAIVTAGLVPALRATRPELDVILRHGPTRTTGGRERPFAVLVGSQVACAVALLVAAMITARTMANVYAIDLGFDASSVGVAIVDLVASRYPTEEARFEFFERVRAQLSSAPHIEATAVAEGLMSSGYGYWDFETQSGPVGESLLTSMNRVSDGYFETMGVRIVAGRTFSPADMGAPVVIVNRTLANRFWPSGDAVGSWLRDRDDPTGLRRTVIGVVEDIDARVQSHERIALQWYEPWPRHDTATGPSPQPFQTFFPLWILVRTAEPGSAAAALKAAVWAVDPLRPIDEVASAADLWLGLFARQRLVQRVIGAFATVAVLLVTVGVFGVLSQAVVRRRREIGVRMALGATPARVRRMIVSRAGVTIALGIAVGLAGAVALARMLEAVLVGVTPLDPVSFASAVAIITVVGLAAAWWPARQAARVEPAVAPRADT